ncbi:N-acetyl-gamma-glutamyl-phosphate reductase [Minicystis rosea]|nr:N-acetyl-gamma-glutamyl-phosphate reductase [Minicystis rosea]
MQKITIGLVGARGYVGREIVAVLAKHPRFAVSFVVSRTQAGQPVAEHLPGAPADLVFEDLGPDQVAQTGVDAVVLALSNGQAEPYVAAIDRVRPETVIVDVSADYRFHSGWAYGLPELGRDRLRGARRIANPGCYATAMALALDPVLDVIDGPAHAFGISGYSGAGATPSPRNDVDLLRDNIMPYSVVDHVHEREVSRQVSTVHFVPHVAPFFRGITMTTSFAVRRHPSTLALRQMYLSRYAEEPLVSVVDDIPLVRDAAGKPHATIGGITVAPDGTRAVVVSTLDNLLKGAASQAVQNLNLAFDLPETMGILPWQS